ncbi:MAG: hypothetical protein LAN59_14610 [Acidobacteriia bacterium]|nr:hypothetical protein [Terriglobia bacterium]
MTRTAGALAEYLGAKLTGDPLATISGVASPERARVGDLIYLDSLRYRERAAASAARCVVVPPGEQMAGKTLLEARDPKLAFAKPAWVKTAACTRASPCMPASTSEAASSCTPAP